MHTLYITDNGLYLKRRSNRIMVKKGDKIIEEIPILDLKRVLIFGNNQVTTDLMKLLASKGIETAFLSSQGKYCFRVVPENSRNIFLRIAQHRHYHNEGFKIFWGRTIIRGKLVNQRNFLTRCRRNRPDLNLDEEIDELKRRILDLDEFADIDIPKIMGMEGSGARTFYKGYGKLLMNGFRMENREYHPPPDPVNALLSFGYMLVFNELTSLLKAFGFDEYLGYLHSAQYGRESLALDLMEEFRTPIIDRLVMFLINMKVIKPEEFTKTEKGVRMSDPALKAYLKNYERYMTTLFSPGKKMKSTTYRKLFREKIENVEENIMEGVKYKPYIFDV